MDWLLKGDLSMARPVRHTGINGARLRYLRHQEQWTQTDLANRLGVHRATLARWESGDGDAPYEVAEQMAELFKVPPGYLFEVAPVPDYEGPVPDGVIRDPELQRIPLAKLQKNTRPALRAAGLTLKQLARKLPKLPVERLQELMNGQKPTAAEVQLLKENLGADFNPISPLKRRILKTPASTKDADLKSLILLAEQVVMAIEQTSTKKGADKKREALNTLAELAQGIGLNPPALLMDIVIEAAVQRAKSGQTGYS